MFLNLFSSSFWFSLMCACVFFLLFHVEVCLFKVVYWKLLQVSLLNIKLSMCKAHLLFNYLILGLQLTTKRYVTYGITGELSVNMPLSKWLFIMENTQLCKDNITKIIFTLVVFWFEQRERNKKQNKCKNKNCAVQDVKTVNMSYVIIIIIIIIFCAVFYSE